MYRWAYVIAALSASLDAATVDLLPNTDEMKQDPRPTWVEQYHQEQYERDVYDRQPDFKPYLRSQKVRRYIDPGLIQETEGEPLPQEQVVPATQNLQTDEQQELYQESVGPQQKQDQEKPKQAGRRHESLLQELIEKQVQEAQKPPFRPSDRRPKAPGILRSSMIIQAIKEGRVDQLARALRLGMSPNQKSREGETPVELAIINAAMGGKGLQMLQYLVRAGASLETLTSKGDTPLTLALKERATDVVAYLITQGVNMRTPDAAGNNPLQIIIMNGDMDAFEYFVHRNLGINDVNSVGDRPLDTALRHMNVEMAMELIAEGALVGERDADRLTPLHRAAEANQFDVVALLVQRGASTNLRAGPELNSPLNISAKNADFDSVKFMMRSGDGNVNLPNAQGQTAIILAGSNPRTTVDMINFLINNGAIVGAVDSDGNTALHAAASAGNIPVILNLLRKGSIIDQPNNRGETALYAAARANKLDTVKALLDRHANVNTTPSPLEGAIEGGDERVVKLLIEKGASI